MKVVPSFWLSVVICCLDLGGGGSARGDEMSIICMIPPISNTQQQSNDGNIHSFFEQLISKLCSTNPFFVFSITNLPHPSHHTHLLSSITHK